MTTPIHYQSLSALVQLMRDGSLSAVEVTEHHLHRIETLEPKLHAFAAIRANEARAEAKAADVRRARGERLGPLHGAPVAVKDLCAMAGTKTHAGGFFSTGFKPDETATVVKRLQEAGAIIIGKAQLTEGAWGAHHPDIPAPVNPWAPHRWSGSSSSGSGVSVAAGQAAASIGTDTAGSIRFPSAANGIVGLKPTWGRVSRHGVFPLSDTFDHVGPMARTVQDAALVFSAIAGPDQSDPTALDLPGEDWVAAAASGTLKNLRIGVDRNFTIKSVDPVMGEAFSAALELCLREGAEIVDIRLPPVDHMLEGAMIAALTEAAISHANTYPSEKQKYSKYYSGLLDIGRKSAGVEYARLSIWRREFSGALARIFKTIDVMAVPVLPIPPMSVAEMDALSDAPPLASAPVLKFTIPFNLAGVPSLTLPMARLADQTPLGFQFIGPALGERKLLAAGAAFERASPLGKSHPAI